MAVLPNTSKVLGYKPRTTQEKLRVAEALEGLPELARALDTGKLGWCAVRELTRVALPDTEGAWLAAAQGKTIRQLEELVATKSLGDAPEPPATQPPRSRVLRFDVAPETYALFRDAMRELRRSAGGRLNDDAVLLVMARHLLAGPGDEGRAPYQVSLTVCAAAGEPSSSGVASPYRSAPRSWPWPTAMANTSVSSRSAPPTKMAYRTPLRRLPRTLPTWACQARFHTRY
jgi:hypothetical protein